MNRWNNVVQPRVGAIEAVVGQLLHLVACVARDDADGTAVGIRWMLAKDAFERLAKEMDKHGLG